MKLTNNLSIESTLQKYVSKGFTPMQIEQIQLGLEAGLDVDKYAIRRFNGVVMLVLRELIESDDNFTIDKFISCGALNVEYLLAYHKNLAYNHRTFSRLSDNIREYVLSGTPYYVS